MARSEMELQELTNIASSLVAEGKGLLAMDESTPTCNSRFAKLGIPETEEARRAYRQLLVTTPGLGDYISGAILYDETIRQTTNDGTPFIEILAKAGIIPGIKVDIGASRLASHPREKITAGLDGLRERLEDYFAMGARFAKWRGVITWGNGTPSRTAIAANAQALARYAALCHEAGLVPIVEPELVMSGNQSMERCFEVTETILHSVFEQLQVHGVPVEAIILKPNMILPGLACARQEPPDEVADATVTCLRRAVPAAVPAIAFLSGGQSGEVACARLNAMIVRCRAGGAQPPWALTFSFGRALQQPATQIWHGDERNVAAAQQALLHRARCSQAARRGDYSPAMETRPGA